jgi:predicted GTPase
MSRRAPIMGIASRDFHNFSAVYRDRAHHEAPAFTAPTVTGALRLILAPVTPARQPAAAPGGGDARRPRK